MRSFLLIGLMSANLLSGCLDSSSPYGLTVDRYVANYPKVELAMSIAEVDAILAPTQTLLANSERKRPDKYKKKGIVVDIVYYRSGWNSDGITTDDEFTPYVFENKRLVAIGWQSIGGAKSQGQAQDINTTSTSVTVY